MGFLLGMILFYWFMFDVLGERVDTIYYRGKGVGRVDYLFGLVLPY